MLYTFNYRAKDLTSDAGQAFVSIVAESQEKASAFLTDLLQKKGRSALVFKRTSTLPYSTGVVFENVEQAQPEPSKAQKLATKISSAVHRGEELGSVLKRLKAEESDDRSC